MLIDFPPVNCLHSLPISCSYKYDNQENKDCSTATQEPANAMKYARLQKMWGKKKKKKKRTRSLACPEHLKKILKNKSEKLHI